MAPKLVHQNCKRGNCMKRLWNWQRRGNRNFLNDAKDHIFRRNQDSTTGWCLQALTTKVGVKILSQASRSQGNHLEQKHDETATRPISEPFLENKQILSNTTVTLNTNTILTLNCSHFFHLRELLRTSKFPKFFRCQASYLKQPVPWGSIFKAPWASAKR